MSDGRNRASSCIRDSWKCTLLYVTFRLHDDFHVKSLKVKCEMSRDIISTPSFPDGCLIVVGVFR